MVFLYILLALMLLICMLLLLSVRLTFTYGDVTKVKIGAIFFNYDLMANRSKPKKSKPKKKKQTQSVKTGKENTQKKSIFSEFTENMEILDFVSLLKKFLFRMDTVFHKRLRIRLKRFIIDVSAETPDKAAILFGCVSGAASMLLDYLSVNTNLYPIEKSKVAVRCDFDAKTTTADIEVVLKLRLVFFVGYAIGAFFDFINFKESKTNKSSLKGTLKNERN